MSQFKVYRSSAGSGKTFTLTKEYLKLALVAPEHLRYNSPYNPNYFKHILAITFTNDAAREMKHRILKDLGEMTEPKTASKNAVFACMLAEIPTEYAEWELAQKPEKLAELLQKRAAMVYRYILHYYSDFSVSTIDSFTNRLARSFSKDLDLPYNYEIQLSTEEVIEQAVYQLIEEADEKKNPKLANLLVKFAYQRLENETNWNIDNLLKEFAKYIFDESKTDLLKPLYALTQDDFATIETQLKQYQKDFEAKILAISNPIIQIIDNNGLEKGHFYYGDFHNYIYKHTEVDKEMFKPTSDRLSKSISENKWISDKGKKAAKQNVFDEFAPVFAKAFYDLESLKKQELSNFLAVAETLPNLYQLALLSEIGKRINTILAEDNAASLASLNEKILKIVEESPVPYIYERIGEKYFHILIDEFQDTSHVQWNNLLPLLANSLDNQRMCMVVGDAKQAIYRWRGGNADAIAALPALPTIAEKSPHKASEGTFEEYFEGNSLASNRRSLAQVVNFNNDIFTWILNNYPYPKLKKHYIAHTQEAAYQKKDNDREYIALTMLNAESGDYHENTAKKVVETIENLLTKGYHYGDIVLLLRSKAHAAFLSAKLVESKIPITSDESLKLANSTKVLFIVNFISLLAQPLDPHKKAEILFFLQDLKVSANLSDKYEKLLTEDEIQEIANEPDLEQFGVFVNRKFGYHLHFENLQYLSLYEIAEELIRTFDFQQQPEDRVYLASLLENISSFTLRHGNNALDFMEYWQRKGDNLSVSMSQSKEDNKAVRIMTIHKSKGLEFPVVIIPFAEWETDSKANQLWVQWEGNKIAPKLPLALLRYAKVLEETEFAANYLQEQQEAFIDSINLLYVALTRAKEQLHVFYKNPKAKKGGGKQKTNVLLDLYAQEAPNAEKIIDENDNETYIFCQNEEIRKKEKAKEPDFLSQFISTECRDKIRIRNKDAKAEETQISILDLHNARNKGNIMHLAFERLEYAADLEKAINSLVNEGITTQAEGKAMATKMKNILQHPDLEDFFVKKPQRRIFNERELLVKPKHYSEINRIIRPDRVIIDEDTQTVVIIDYKTGEAHESHPTQINRYAQRFVEMGYKTVQKYLVYTETEQVVKVG